MSKDKSKPASDTEAAAPPTKRETVTNNLTGRVTHDDRGNAVWEWAVNTGSFTTDGATQRLKKLENVNLSIADDARTGPLQGNPLGTVKGYSPYDSGVLEKKAAPRKTDLRKLSEWLKLKKQAASNQGDDKPDDE